jgi:L,D-transpeptidase YcbB
MNVLMKPLHQICTLLILFSFYTGAAQASLEAEIQSITEHLVQDGEGHLPTGGVIYQPAIIEEFYYENGYRPAWNEKNQVVELVNSLGNAGIDGLNPEDYHYAQLKALLDDASEMSFEVGDRVRARFDVLLTDGVILYIRHLMQGKVDPRDTDPAFNYSRINVEPQTVARQLKGAIANRTVHDVMEEARPTIRFYRLMQDALAHYRTLAANESFTEIPADVVLKPSESHANVAALRQRLMDLGYLESATTSPISATQFDDQLESAVRSFQKDNNLDADGIVGRNSFALLNLSWADRVDLLRINMDRVRWVYRDLSDDVVVVNIAGFELYYLRDNQIFWETPVMVGTIAHQTPIFTERLRYLEFNPTWTVPRSIIRRSLFPKFSANPQYVIDNDYHLIDSKGQLADPLQIDWSAYSGRNFPYNVVQQPGPGNALGRVKFMFPNRHAIYLHDTPSRALFSKSSRAFSAGCVRVKNPLEFAEILLKDPGQWSLQQIEDLIESEKPIVRAQLKRPVDVMLMYWTASPTPDDGVQFHPDLYTKDPATLAALNAPPPIE